MAKTNSTLNILRGTKDQIQDNIVNISPGQLVYSTNTQELYIGSGPRGTGIEKINGKELEDLDLQIINIGTGASKVGRLNSFNGGMLENYHDVWFTYINSGQLATTDKFQYYPDGDTLKVGNIVTDGVLHVHTYMHNIQMIFNYSDGDDIYNLNFRMFIPLSSPTTLKDKDETSNVLENLLKSTGVSNIPLNLYGTFDSPKIIKHLISGAYLKYNIGKNSPILSINYLGYGITEGNGVLNSHEYSIDVVFSNVEDFKINDVVVQIS